MTAAPFVPPLRYAAPVYPGGRHCLLCGATTFGAVFPPAGSAAKWAWRLFPFGAHPSITGEAATEGAAKAALMAAFLARLDEACLEFAQ